MGRHCFFLFGFIDEKYTGDYYSRSKIFQKISVQTDIDKLDSTTHSPATSAAR